MLTGFTCPTSSIPTSPGRPSLGRASLRGGALTSVSLVSQQGDFSLTIPPDVFYISLDHSYHYSDVCISPHGFSLQWDG